ncbi:MAG: DUF4908 domain-containing protein [Myxococcota bacterium]|nr:DUF4908 domain-containing protein [Myxococcota bacterium]
MIPTQALLESLLGAQGQVSVHLRGGQTLRGRLRGLDAQRLLLEGQSWHLVDRAQITAYDLQDTSSLRDLLLSGADELRGESPPTALALKRRVAALETFTLELDWSQWQGPAERLSVLKVVESVEQALAAIRQEFGDQALSRAIKVQLERGRAPAVSVVDGDLRLAVAPSQGRPGRPSAQTLQQVLESIL